MSLLESSFPTPGPERLITWRHGHYHANDLTQQEWKPGDPDPVLPTLEEVAQDELSELGRAQALRSGGVLYERFPDLHVVLSSDWKRPIQTAQGISQVYQEKRGNGLVIEESEVLRERTRGTKYDLMPRAWIAEREDYQTFLDFPGTWVPNPNGQGAERGEALVSKAEKIQRLWPLMGELASRKTLLLATHGEVAGGTALIAFAGFGDEELKRPLPGQSEEWWPRTINNCHGYIFEDLTERQGRYSYGSMMGIDASKPDIRTTSRIAINTPYRTNSEH
jgi:broad specificity phosphatase PhoE